jgi:hypothetical protein
MLQQLRRQERVFALVEEVVAPPNTLQTQQLAPNPRDLIRDFAQGRLTSVHRPTGANCLRAFLGRIRLCRDRDHLHFDCNQRNLRMLRLLVYLFMPAIILHHFTPCRAEAAERRHSPRSPIRPDSVLLFGFERREYSLPEFHDLRMTANLASRTLKVENYANSGFESW